VGGDEAALDPAAALRGGAQGRQGLVRDRVGDHRQAVLEAGDHLGQGPGEPQARALFGDQGTRQALREMRIAPVMQLGLRYAF